MRTRRDHRSATDESPMANVKKLAAITGVVTVCAAALGGACGDPTSNTTGAGGAGLSASSSSGGGVGGVGGEDLSVVAGSVTVGSGSSSSSSGLPPPKCAMGSPTDGATKFSSAFGDANVQTGSAIVYDKSGNILVAGSFGGSINLGATTLNSAGTDDVFVAKFSPLGQLMWAKSFGDAGLQTATGIGVDTNGNVYVAGNFKGSINFGGGALNAAGVLSIDVFLAKLTCGARSLAMRTSKTCAVCLSTPRATSSSLDFSRTTSTSAARCSRVAVDSTTSSSRSSTRVGRINGAVGLAMGRPIRMRVP
jgi:hypothetical protein